MCGWPIPIRRAPGGGSLSLATRPGSCAAWIPGGWAFRLQSAHPDPAVRVGSALSVLAPAAFGAAFIFAVVPWASWIVFAFGWMLFPAVGQLAGSVAELGRRAAAGVTLLAIVAPSRVLTDGAEALRSVAAIHRVGRSAATIPPGRDRRDAELVAAAAARLATAAADPDVQRVVRDAFVEPTADLLTDYGRLAAAAPEALRPELESVAADFPLLAGKLDGLAVELRAGGGAVVRPPALLSSATGADGD